MPYRHASLVIVAVIAATVFAFWRSYFGRLTTAPMGFHAHGVTASLWMLLLLAQSWTPHRRQLPLHRVLGRTTFVAAPLFAAGSMGVLHSMAVATAQGDLFYARWGPPLGFIDLLAFGGFLYAIAMALAHRRSVGLHSGYMLSTVLLLLSPILGRVFNQTVPGLVIRGPQDFPVFGWGAQAGNLVAAATALWLWRRDPRFGRPWAIACGICVAQIVGFETIGRTDAWRSAFLAAGVQPLPLLMAIGVVAGAGAVWLGWSAVPPRTKVVAAG